MSIVASVKVNDGIVLATDSTTQIHGTDQQGNIGFVKSYHNVRKLFRLGALPIGVMFYGIGNIGRRSIENLLLEFIRDKLGEPCSVEEVSGKLLTFFHSFYMEQFKEVLKQVDSSPKQLPLFGAFIAGYSKGTYYAEEWEFVIPRDDKIKKVRDKEAYGASWRGITLPFSRLYNGYDPRLIDALKRLGVDEDIIKQATSGLKSPVIYDGMPVADAINFARYILQTTIGLASFEIGVESCGEPIDIAIILPDGAFKWVEQKSS
ncbi:hypothetical protein FJZ31_09705 [Candidatus Poribacteria bacterium]|nr:hypothetical protein [Candidatus Poribacteria bacterium]